MSGTKKQSHIVISNNPFKTFISFDSFFDIKTEYIV